MDTSTTRLVIRDRPTALWVTGAVVAGIGIFMTLFIHGPWWLLLTGAGLGLVIALFAPVLTITVDKTTGFLTLDYRSLVRHSTREIGLHEIEAIQVDQRVSHDSDGTSTTYQIVAITRDGSHTPFRSYYSSGWRGKQKVVEQLRAFTGVGGTDPGLGGMFKLASQLASGEFAKQQERQTGPLNEEHVTDGVRWQVQTAAFGGTPVTRWFSPSCKMADGFLYLAQIVKGQKMFAGGLMSSLNSSLLKASMAVYGLGENEAPGLDQAAPFDLAGLDPRLAQSFSAYSNNPTGARQTLNPWAVRPLAAWAERHPLKQFQSGYGGQLVVLFGAQGLTLGTFGVLTTEQVQELTTLGVELVRAQGTPGA